MPPRPAVTPDPLNPEHVALARAGPMGWAWMCSRGKYKRPPHVLYKHQRIAAVLRSPTGGRILLHEPPRHSKTLTLQYVAGWFMGMNPDRDVIYGTHTKTLADRFGGKVRGDLDEYGMAVFGQGLDQSNRAKSDWSLTGGGEFFGVGVGGSPHGRGSALLITDDMVPNAEAARSKVQMASIDESLRSDLFSRRSMGWYAHIGSQTRWSENDPHGIIQTLYPDLYDIVEFPAIATEADILGRKPGDALWPEAFPLHVLEEIRQGMHAHRWSALYQQNPIPMDGDIWDGAWWEGQEWWHGDDGRVHFSDGYTCALGDMHRYGVCDIAASEKELADWTVLGTAAICPDGRIVILDWIRERMGGPGLIKRAHAQWVKHEWSTLWAEVSGNLAFVQTMRASGLPIRTIGRANDDDLTLKGDKVNVAMSATPAVSDGRLWMPRQATWLADLVSELLSFPNSTYKDQADVFAWIVKVAEKVGHRPSAAPAIINGMRVDPNDPRRARDRKSAMDEHWAGLGGKRPW